MTLPYRQSHLWRYLCGQCNLVVRSRLYDKTLSEARYHAWTEHRMSVTGVPTECLWDVRIQGKDVLLTFDVPGEL